MLDLSANLSNSRFSRSYQEARKYFLTQLDAFSSEMVCDQQEFKHALTGPDGELLTCNVAFLSQNPAPESILVLMSATHGVEGFCGSAIQSDVLPLLQPLLTAQPKLGVVLVHAFNPWGFAWLRRYDHEGIDLNRNFVDYSQPLPVNKEYALLHESLINFEDPIAISNLEQWVRQLGQNKVDEIITRGQYQFANGYFYGGAAPSWSRQNLEQITSHHWFSTAKKIAVIDLHTGLGPYGYGELINDHELDSPGYQRVNQWYGNNAQSAVLGESCSGIKVGLVDFHWHKLIGDRGCFVTLEFGTYDFNQLMQALKIEQQYYNTCQRQGLLRDPNDPAVQQLKNFFYPEEKSWQQQVLFRGRQVASMALEGLL